MWDCKCGRKYNFDGKRCKGCGANPPSSQQKEVSPPIKQKKELTIKISLKRGKSSQDKPKDKQQKKPEKQVQKQPPQLPPKGNRSKTSMAKDEPKVTQTQKKKATGEKQNTHNLWGFSNVILFTGSASYIDANDLPTLSDSKVQQNQYQLPPVSSNKWNHEVFMKLIIKNLPHTFASSHKWQFILNTSKNSFKEGERQFKFYSSKDSYPNTGKDCGKFVCASSFWDSKPSKYKLPDGKTEVVNTSSYMLRADLSKWVESIDVGFPVFSVGDCNTFHTTGYVWGYYALKKASNFFKPLKLAVINFDQHEDTGGSGDVIGSDHWGNGVLKELEDLGHGGLYAVVGVGNKGDVYIFKSKESKLDLGSLSNGNVNWNHFWNNGGKDINAVFVTVDRDCLKNHYTQWQDNSYFQDLKKLQEAMSDALKPLFNKDRKVKAYLIGFDITGLPENKFMWQGRYPERAIPLSSELWATIDSQIVGLRHKVESNLEDTAKLLCGKET